MSAPSDTTSPADVVQERRSSPCRVCGSTDTRYVGPPAYRRPTHVAGVSIDLTGLRPGHYRCDACGYGFIDPLIPEERLLDCYRRASGGHWETSADVAVARNYAHKRGLLERHAPGRRVLDFGCYDGGFLAFLGNAWDRAGIEPAAAAASVAESRGVRVLGPTVESVDAMTTPPFDAAVVFDVMEHLNRPVETLSALAGLLRPGGVMLVETGNSDAWPWRRQRQRYPYCGLVEHVGFWNHTSIAAAGRGAGMEVAHFEESVHTAVPWGHRVRNGVHNLMYRGLRAAYLAGAPLDARSRDIALGPFPRTIQPRDHFLAVLRKRVAGG